MELFDPSHLHHLIDYLHTHPEIGGLVTFGIAFLESLALIGGIVPGSVTMTAIGALIGSGAMPMFSTILWAILGAFVGDFLSYGIGAYYNERLRNMWPFKRYPQWLTLGEAFFHKHGGKSVVIGRFVGPARSLVPLTAGLVHMPIWRFAFATSIAAILWSVVYIAPGIVVGVLSLGLSPQAAVKFILIVLAIVAFGWIIFVLIHLFFKKVVALTDRGTHALWQWLEQHPLTHGLTKLLSASNKPNQHRQLMLAVLVILASILFLYTLANVITQGRLTHLNQPVGELLRSLHTQLGDSIMLMMTLLGDKYVQLTAGACLLGWLFWKRYIRAAWHWLCLVGLSCGLAEALKKLYYSPRPEGLLNPQLTSSFPSGHTLLATALFSFLAMLIAHHLPAGRRKTPFLIAGFFIAAVGLSRIYLGAHWLTDVLASLFLGISCATAINLSFLRRESSPLPTKKLATVAISIFLAIWMAFSWAEFRKQQENYTLYWPTVTLDTATWWKHPRSEIPLFILSRLGKSEAVLNVQWLDSLDNIRHTLQAQGWVDQPIRLNWKSRLTRLSAKTNPEHLPILPALYQNKSPALMMTKEVAGAPFPLHFLLWKSNVTLADTQQTLWVGSVHYFIPRAHKKMVAATPSEIHQLYKDAMQIFTGNLANKKQQQRHIPTSEQPAIMRSLHWDGKLLLISEP
jgi:membrane protein DedA with SNARE-associated domain/membrane-associated phospholipid phosphatase